MIKIKTDEEIELIRESSLIVSNTLAEVAKNIKEGVTGLELDKIGEEFIRDHKGVPAFKGYGGFPNSLCISKNSEVVHGIPDDYQYRNGDIVSIDCGVILNGYFGDSAFTFAIGEIDQEVDDLLVATKISLQLAIDNAIVGKRLGDIGFAVQNYCEVERNYGVVRELVGHGIGTELHEAPEVPNFGRRGHGMKLKENMVIAIEPMINLGTKHVITLEDDWTVATRDGKVSAHYEHTVAVKPGKADVLTSFDPIFEAIEKNVNLLKVTS